MTLKSRIENDLKEAMLSKDRFLVDTLRDLRSAILNEEIAKGARDEGLNDEAVEQVLVREAKKRDEAAELFEKGGRAESAQKERDEKQVISRYLPEQISEAELQAIIDEVVAELQPEGMKDMGRVIGAVKARTGNAADGAAIARLVKSTLN